MPSNNETILMQNVADLQAQLAAANGRIAELLAELTKERARLDWMLENTISEQLNGKLTQWCSRDELKGIIDKMIAAEAAGGGEK